MEEKIRQALARAYTTDRNSNKELDSDLLTDMTKEIMEAVREMLPEKRDMGDDTYCNHCGEMIASPDCECNSWNKCIEEIESKLK